MNKRGSVPIVICAAVPTILLTGVFAIDATRYWLREARLQSALDAGALMAARDINSPNRDANVKALVAAVYNENAPGGQRLSAADVNVTPVGTDQVAVSASVGNTPLLNSLKIPYMQPKATATSQTISGSATANRTTKGIELALVFDITLSMIDDDGGQTTRIRAARDAALIMLETLYGDLPRLQNGAPNPANKKWLENLFISVVPFNVTVNYGAANTHFLGAAPPASDYPTSWSGPTRWGGCAEMRSVSLLDANTQNPSNGLRRYYWPSTYNAGEKYDPNRSNNVSQQPYCLSTAAYVDNRNGNPSGAHHVCMGHNDWTAPAYVLSGSNGSGSKQNRLIINFAGNSLVRDAGLDAWATAHGPNMMCPPDTGDRLNNRTVLPLTRDRATVDARIKALANLPFSYGTNIAAGLQAGWFTLSPN